MSFVCVYMSCLCMFFLVKLEFLLTFSFIFVTIIFLFAVKFTLIFFDISLCVFARMHIHMFLHDLRSIEIVPYLIFQQL